MSSWIHRKSYLQPLAIISFVLGTLSIAVSVLGTSYLLNNIEYFLGALVLLITILMTSIVWSIRDNHKREIDRLQTERIMFMSLLQETLEKSAKDKVLAPSFEGIQKKVEEFINLYPYENNIAFIGSHVSNDRYNQIYEIIKDTVKPRGFRVFRPTDQQITPDIFSNLMVLLLGCKYGVAVFDVDPTGASTQNIAFELGIMYSMGKEVVVLKNAEASSIPIDLIHFLYYEYRSLPEIGPIVETWIRQRVEVDLRKQSTSELAHSA